MRRLCPTTSHSHLNTKLARAREPSQLSGTRLNVNCSLSRENRILNLSYHTHVSCANTRDSCESHLFDRINFNARTLFWNKDLDLPTRFQTGPADMKSLIYATIATLVSKTTAQNSTSIPFWSEYSPSFSYLGNCD